MAAAASSKMGAALGAREAASTRSARRSILAPRYGRRAPLSLGPLWPRAARAPLASGPDDSIISPVSLRRPASRLRLRVCASEDGVDVAVEEPVRATDGLSNAGPLPRGIRDKLDPNWICFAQSTFGLFSSQRRKAGPLEKGGTLSGLAAAGKDPGLAARGASLPLVAESWSDPRWVKGTWDLAQFKSADGQARRLRASTTFGCACVSSGSQYYPARPLLSAAG